MTRAREWRRLRTLPVHRLLVHADPRGGRVGTAWKIFVSELGQTLTTLVRSVEYVSTTAEPLSICRDYSVVDTSTNANPSFRAAAARWSSSVTISSDEGRRSAAMKAAAS
jgi:hypothetical protein